MSDTPTDPISTLPRDETEENLNAYLETLSLEHLEMYDPDWNDEDVINWDGNFRSDGALMLVCCERDVEVSEFRKAVEEHLNSKKIKT